MMVGNRGEGEGRPGAGGGKVKAGQVPVAMS